MNDDKKLIPFICIAWALLTLFFVFVVGLFDVPFYVEYDESIEVAVNNGGRGLDYEEEEGRLTVVGWSIILLSLLFTIRILDSMKSISNNSSKVIGCGSRVLKKNHKLFLNLCIFGIVVFIIAEAILFKVLLFRAYEQVNLGHFTFLNFISTVIHIALVLLIYMGCKKLYKELLDKDGKF